MARGPSRFRQRDLTAAIRAAEAAGKTVSWIDVGPDGAKIVFGREPAQVSAQRNEWDDDPLTRESTG